MQAPEKKETWMTKCLIIKDLDLKKLGKIPKNIEDLQFNSLLDCNCKLFLEVSKFPNLEFLTFNSKYFCPKIEEYWSNFSRLIYLDISVTFGYQGQLYDLLQMLPNLQYLVLNDLRSLENFEGCEVPIHTLNLKGSVTQPFDLDLTAFLDLRRFICTRSDLFFGKFLKLGHEFQNLITLEIGGLIFEEKGILEYLPLGLRYLKIKHILYPELFMEYLLRLKNLEYLDLQDTYSFNKIAEVIPELTNLQSIFINTINFADLTVESMESLVSAKYENSFLTLDYSYGDILKYNPSDLQNDESKIGEVNFKKLQEIFYLSDTTKNAKGWEIPNARNNTPQQWMNENGFIVKNDCKCKE